MSVAYRTRACVEVDVCEMCVCMSAYVRVRVNANMCARAGECTCARMGVYVSMRVRASVRAFERTCVCGRLRALLCGLVCY